jgi:transcriptional regulator with GAF, ATPase, and Fis domain
METDKKSVERRFYLKHFKAISRAFSSYEDLNLLVDHIAEGLCRSFKIKGCCVMVFDDREQQLFRVGSYGISESYLGKGPIFFDKKHSSFVTGEPALVEDMQNDPRVQYPEAAAKEEIVSMLSVPIKCREEITGLIRMYHSDVLLLHDEDLDSISVLAKHLGLIIENKGLKNFLDGVKVAMESLPLRMLKGL